MTPDPVAEQADDPADDPLSVDVDVRSDNWMSVNQDTSALSGKILSAAWPKVAPNAGPFEVSVVLADDAMLQDLNKQYRDKDTPTNVLSFPSDLIDDPAIPAGEPVPLGDIILSFDTLSREADDLGIELVDHFTHLLVHGMLHLVGFDHETDEEAGVMESQEIDILAEMGIANPYQVDRTLMRG